MQVEEGGWEQGEQALMVIPQEQERQVDIARVISSFESIILAPGRPITERAEDAAHIVRELVGALQIDMVSLGYNLYYIRELKYWNHLPGTYHSFEQWCSLGGQDLNVGLVADAIRFYENWEKLRSKFNIDIQEVSNQPLSTRKAAVIKEKIHRYEKQVKQIKAEFRGNPVELTARIEQEAQKQREILLAVITDPEEVVIQESNQEQGNLKLVDLWLSEITWDQEQTTFEAHLRLSVDPESDKLLPDLVRQLHNQWKSKYFSHARLKGQEALKGLLSVAREMEEEMSQGMDEEDYYYETVEAEEEEEEELADC